MQWDMFREGATEYIPVIRNGCTRKAPPKALHAKQPRKSTEGIVTSLLCTFASANVKTDKYISLALAIIIFIIIINITITLPM
jgi:hypothetical protein